MRGTCKFHAGAGRRRPCEISSNGISIPNKRTNQQTKKVDRQNGLVVKAEVAVPPVAVGSSPLVYIHEKNKLIKH